MRNPHRPFMSKSSEILQQEHRELLLCRQLFGGATKGPATGIIYMTGKHGRVFDPFEKDSDAVIEWMILKHKPEFLATVERFSNNFENLSFRRVVVLRALEIAWYLEKCQSYKDIKITWPDKKADAYFVFMAGANKMIMEAIRDRGIDFFIHAATMGPRHSYFKPALDDILAKVPKAAAERESDVLFGVLSKREVFEEETGSPRPEYNLCTFSYYNRKEKKVNDIGGDNLRVVGYALDAAKMLHEFVRG